MPTLSRLRVTLPLLFIVSTLLAEQLPTDNVGPRSLPIIAAAAAGQSVRFSSPASVCQIRVQILFANGEPLFDSSWKDGNVFDLQTLDSQGQPFASGSYRCLVSVKDLNGQVTRKEATLTAQGGMVSIEQRAGAEGLTVEGPDESSPKITLLAHDGLNGAIVSTSGDLSFRFGNFLAGRDSERMRLTADGNLGIGTDKPQSPLDVNGLIRTSEGIMFPDGTILTTAAGLPGVQGDGEVIRRRSGALGGAPIITRGGELSSPSPSVTSTRLTPRTNAAAYQFVVDGVGVHIGTTSAFGLDVAGNVTLASNLLLPATSSSAGVIMLGGNSFAHSIGTNNTILGPNAGNLTMTGTVNTALGSLALRSDTSGSANTATGASALNANTGSCCNTADGFFALANNTGQGNTALGNGALQTNTLGSSNIGIGSGGGFNLTTGDNNIDIGNQGVAAEASTIRIGTPLTHTRTFIAGIVNVTTGAANAVPVVIDSNGQLGTTSSSRRYKKDIMDMGDATDDLMRLRPVTFRYLAQGEEAPIQYGLIAEEVAEVYPDLVTRNKDGGVESLMYQFLAPMLLNEVQKQRRTIEEQRTTIDALNAKLDALAHRLQALETRAALIR